MLQEFIGKTKSQKLIDECHKIYKDNFQKEFPEYFEHNYTKVASVITILENNEIKQIGMSKINDLLTDNYGKWFGQFIFPTVNFSLTDIAGVARNNRSWSTSGASSVWNQTVVVVGTTGLTATTAGVMIIGFPSVTTVSGGSVGTG